MASCTAEAQFLEARKARAEASRDIATNSRRRTDDLHTFWASFKVFREAWTKQLEQLQGADTTVGSNSNNNASRLSIQTESDKRRIDLELCRLQDQLEHQRKQCFSHHALTEKDTVGNASSASAASLHALSLPTQELSLSDLRLLHTEFTQCRELLDTKRNQLLPKGKFVFRRYREAFRLQQQQVELQQHVVVAVVQGGAPPPCKAVTPMVDPASLQHETKHTLANIRNSLVEIHANGKVTRRPKQPTADGAAATAADDFSDLQLEALDSSPLLLSNIENSGIIIHNGGITALHLLNVSNTTVTCQPPVRTVHVTDCHKLTLRRIQAQQLRLHESTDLECHVCISAGVILEDCTRVVFYSNDCDGLDVRDFNWLRAGVPSPNFVIEQETEPPLLVVVETAKAVGASAEAVTTLVTTSTACIASTMSNGAVETTGGSDEEDDDEEL